MPSLETRTLEVIDRCYAGVFDQSSWQEALTGLADLVGGAGTYVFAMAPASQSVLRSDIARLDPDAFAEFARHWSAYDIRVEPGLKAPVGAPTTGETLVPTGVWRRSVIYNEFLRRNDLFHILAVWLHRGSDRVVALSIQGGRQRGAFSAEERTLLAAVAPHFTRAIELQDRLDLGAGLSTSLVAIADALHVGVLVVDQAAVVLEASEAARRILAAADGIYTIGKRLKFRRPTDERAFMHLLSAPPLASPGPVRLRVPRQPDKGPLSLIVAPSHGSREPWMTGAAQWMVAIFEPAQTAMPTPGAVAREWQVTPAEARVVCLLAGGSSVQRIADTLSVSVHTVRSQLKAVYGKTGLSSQLEVVRRLLADADDMSRQAGP